MEEIIEITIDDSTVVFDWRTDKSADFICDMCQEQGCLGWKELSKNFEIKCLAAMRYCG